MKENVTEIVGSINKSANRYKVIAEGTETNEIKFANPLTQEDMDVLVELTTNGARKNEEKYEDVIRRYTSVDNELKVITKSLVALESATECSESHTKNVNHDNCPTCGQPLLADTRNDRIVEMKQKLNEANINSAIKN